MRRVYVQRCADGAYLTLDDQWTVGAAGARDFGTSLTAFAHCLQNGIEDAQVVIQFPSGGPDIIIPLDRPEEQRSRSGT